MQTTILWTGREYYSLENCLISLTDNGADIRSVIVGMYKDNIYKTEYHIRTNSNWETLYCAVNCHHDDHIQHQVFESESPGKWTLNSQPDPRFDGCTDVDIPLTPFTNTLPIRRLRLQHEEQIGIQVIYIDVLRREISCVNQVYRRLHANRYHYENVPNDFEADIEVDADGFVTDYPTLFVRTMRHESKYPIAG